MADGYHLYPNEPWYSRGLRYFSIHDYSIFYLIRDIEGCKEARVTHVTYGRRDLDRFLSDMKIDQVDDPPKIDSRYTCVLAEGNAFPFKNFTQKIKCMLK